MKFEKSRYIKIRFFFSEESDIRIVQVKEGFSGTQCNSKHTFHNK